MARPERARGGAAGMRRPERRRAAERRRWANVAAIVAGVYALGFAVWSPGLAGGARLEAELRAQGWWWAVGGILPRVRVLVGRARLRARARARTRPSIPPFPEQEESEDAPDDGALVEADRGLAGEAILVEQLRGPGGVEAPFEPEAGLTHVLAGQALRGGDEQVVPDVAAELDLRASEQVAERRGGRDALGHALGRDADVIDDAEAAGEGLESAGRVAPDRGCDGGEADLPRGGAHGGLLALGERVRRPPEDQVAEQVGLGDGRIGVTAQGDTGVAERAGDQRLDQQRVVLRTDAVLGPDVQVGIDAWRADEFDGALPDLEEAPEDRAVVELIGAAHDVQRAGESEVFRRTVHGDVELPRDLDVHLLATQPEIAGDTDGARDDHVAQ